LLAAQSFEISLELIAQFRHNALPCRRLPRNKPSWVCRRRRRFNPALRTEPTLHNLPVLDVERRQDGAVLVRVRSRQVNGRALPDAVFAFRLGDPQFSFWEEQLRKRQIGLPLARLSIS
jgi:hypothetical protein